MACATSCRTKDHRTYGECLRAKNLSTAAGETTKASMPSRPNDALTAKAAESDDPELCECGRYGAHLIGCPAEDPPGSPPLDDTCRSPLFYPGMVMPCGRCEGCTNGAYPPGPPPPPPPPPGRPFA